MNDEVEDGLGQGGGCKGRRGPGREGCRGGSRGSGLGFPKPKMKRKFTFNYLSKRKLFSVPSKKTGNTKAEIKLLVNERRRSRRRVRPVITR